MGLSQLKNTQFIGLLFQQPCRQQKNSTLSGGRTEQIKYVTLERINTII